MKRIARRLIPGILLVLFAAVPVFGAEAPRIPVGDSPTLGPANAPVTIFEFIDFQ